MIKLILSGIWICVITAISSYAAASFWAETQGAEKKQYLEGLNYEQTGVINVPMLAGGALQGYIVAQFVFTADSAALSKLSVPPHSFVVDEAFRQIYSDPNLDFRNLERVDLGSLAKRIVAAVNSRLQSPLIMDVLVEQFSYFSKDDILKQPASGT
jgi:hypothetical protein